jgi:hypothetical protein
VGKHPDLVQQLEDKWNCTKTVNPVRDPIIRAWHGHGAKTEKLMKAAESAYKRKSTRLGLQPALVA